LDVTRFAVGEIFEEGIDLIVSYGRVGADLQVIVSCGYFEVLHDFEFIDDFIFCRYLSHLKGSFADGGEFFYFSGYRR
jgi:hypothetical protein